MLVGEEHPQEPPRQTGQPESLLQYSQVQPAGIFESNMSGAPLGLLNSWQSEPITTSMPTWPSPGGPPTAAYQSVSSGPMAAPLPIGSDLSIAPQKPYNLDPGSLGGQPHQTSYPPPPGPVPTTAPVDGLLAPPDSRTIAYSTPVSISPLLSTTSSLSTSNINSQSQSVSSIETPSLKSQQSSTATSSPLQAENVGPSSSKQTYAQDLDQVRVDFVAAPKGTPQGQFMIKNWDSFQRQTDSRKVDDFISVGNYLVSLPVTKYSIPAYNPRKSRNQLRQLGLSGKQDGRSRSRPSSNASDSDSDSHSSEYDDSDSEEEPEETFPITSPRPSEPGKAIAYDTVKAVWAPRNRPAEASQIRQGLASFWAIIKPIRDNWKEALLKFRKAEDNKKSSAILARPVERQRSYLESALQAALDYGHPDMVRHFPKAKSFFAVFEQQLSDRANDLDFDSKLCRAILEILATCTTYNPDTLKESRIQKVLSKFIKKGNPETRSLASRISKQLPATLPAAAPASASKPAEAAVKKPSPANSQKSAASDASAPSSAASAVTAKKPVAAGLAKPKAAPVSKSSVFAALSKPSPAAKPSQNVAPSKPASKPAFSFAETMANLAKPKEPEQKVKPKEQKVVESAEDRAKRLRKESRRHLRVVWAAPAELEQIQTFQSHPEESRRVPGALKDLDVNNEGLMFKKKKLVDNEDDDNIEDHLHSWSCLVPVDFSCIAVHDRSRHYVRYGGDLETISEDKNEQIKREATVLSVHYSSTEEIPTTPKEPPAPPTPKSNPVVAFGAPSYLVTTRLVQLGLLPPARAPPVQSQPQPTVTPDLASILSQLGAVAPQPAPAPVPQDQGASEVTNILSKLRESGLLPAEPASAPPPPTIPGISALASVFGAPSTATTESKGSSNPPGSMSELLDQLRKTSAATSLTYQQGMNGNSHDYYGYGREEGHADFDYDRLPQGPAGAGPNFYGRHGNPEAEGRKRGREGAFNGGYGYGNAEPFEYDDRETKRRWKNKFEDKTSRVVCRFWREGKCRKGESCPFRHSM